MKTTAPFEPLGAASTSNEDVSPDLPDWLGFGAKFAHVNLDGPHDMAAVRASIAEKRLKTPLRSPS